MLTAGVVVSFCNAGGLGLQDCLLRETWGSSSSESKLPPELRAGAGRCVSPCAACTAPPRTTPSWINLFSLSSVWTSTKEAETAHSSRSWNGVPRSEMRHRKEKQALLLPVLYLLSEWTSNFTFLACWSEVFLKHQIHTEKINDSSVITHPIAISYPFIYYTSSKMYRTRKKIKA